MALVSDLTTRVRHLSSSSPVRMLRSSHRPRLPCVAAGSAFHSQMTSPCGGRVLRRRRQPARPAPPRVAAERIGPAFVLLPVRMTRARRRRGAPPAPHQAARACQCACVAGPRRVRGASTKKPAVKGEPSTARPGGVPRTGAGADQVRTRCAPLRRSSPQPSPLPLSPAPCRTRTSGAGAVQLAGTDSRNATPTRSCAALALSCCGAHRRAGVAQIARLRAAGEPSLRVNGRRRGTEAGGAPRKRATLSAPSQGVSRGVKPGAQSPVVMMRKPRAPSAQRQASVADSDRAGAAQSLHGARARISRQRVVCSAHECVCGLAGRACCAHSACCRRRLG